MKVIIQQPIALTTIQLTEDQAYLFKEFQKRYEVIGRLIGFLDTLNLKDFNNTSITLDIDGMGKVGHSSITRHFRT